METRHETHAGMNSCRHENALCLHESRHETHAGMNSCRHETRHETFQITSHILGATKAIWFSYRPDMRKLCLHEIFIPFPCRHDFHAGMKKRHEIFMSPRNESFMSPRHHVNTTVAQTSTRYETRAGMKLMPA